MFPTSKNIELTDSEFLPIGQSQFDYHVFITFDWPHIWLMTKGNGRSPNLVGVGVDEKGKFCSLKRLMPT